MNIIDTYLNKQYELQQELAFKEFEKDTKINELELDWEVYQLIRKSFFLSYNQGHYDAEISCKNAYKLYPHKYREWVKEEKKWTIEKVYKLKGTYI